MKRNAYFIHTCIYKLIPERRKKGSIGCDGGLEAVFPCYSNEIYKLGMQKRLAHKVKIKVIGIRAQFFRKKRELIFVKAFGRARRSGAK
jgi:hypothetical protein